MGLLYAADLLGIALFQIMTVRLSSVDGAATQIVMMLTSIAYLPAVGIAMTGTTLVGQSIGAGDREWAMRVGNATIKLSVVYMALIGVFLAAGRAVDDCRWFLDPAGSAEAAGGRARALAGLDRRGLPDLRWPESRQRPRACAARAMRRCRRRW